MDHHKEHENGGEHPVKPPEADKQPDAEQSKQDKPKQPGVMDVHMPRPATPGPVPAPAEPKPEANSTPQPKSADLSKLAVPEDEPEKPEIAPEPTREDKRAPDPKPVINKPPKPPKQPGVGLAIFATIVIVLLLSALATYAYLKTNGANIP